MNAKGDQREGWRLSKGSVPLSGFQTPSTLRDVHIHVNILPPLFGFDLDCARWTAPSLNFN